MLPDIEIAGQEKLLAASVLIVGMGGLGSPVAMYLAAAGVGQLVLNDFDQVEINNLQRQIIHRDSDIGRAKVESARDTLQSINPQTQIEVLSHRLDAAEMFSRISAVDLVVDASDNFSTRFAINEACVKTRTPLVSGAAIRFEGQVMVYDPDLPDCPCYSCLYETVDDSQLNCATNGVAAPVVGVIGSIQAMEALKLITGAGQSLAGYLLIFDARTMDWKKLRLPRKKNCKVCSLES